MSSSATALGTRFVEWLEVAPVTLGSRALPLMLAAQVVTGLLCGRSVLWKLTLVFGFGMVAGNVSHLMGWWPPALQMGGNWVDSLLALTSLLVVALALDRDDLSARRELEQLTARQRNLEQTGLRLSKAATEWSRTFDTITDLIVVADEGGQIVRSNSAAAAIFGQDVKSIVGKALCDLEPRALATRLEECVRAAVHSDRRLNARLTLQEPNQVWQAVTLPWILPSGAPGAVAVLRDMTELEELSRRIASRDRMAEVGAFVTGIAHEVRNPLFGIAANLEALEDALGGDERAGEFMLRAKREIDRLSHLMHDLLEYGRPVQKPKVLVEPPALVARAVEHCQDQAAGRGVVLCTDLAASLPAVRLNEEQVTQSLVNLVENAIAFAPPKSTVEIGARGSSGRVTFRVEDRGPGFAEEDLARAGEPFFTRRKGGTGLGLAIVKRAAEDHRGELRLANSASGGAIVELTLCSENR